jgi:hypothetical protein
VEWIDFLGLCLLGGLFLFLFFMNRTSIKVNKIQEKNPFQYIEGLHFKYRKQIEALKYPSFTYDKKNTLSLLFVDDRYNPVFPLLLRLFMYSLPHAQCNFHIFCMEEDKKRYEDACIECRMYGTIFHLIEEPILNQNNYSKLLTQYNFWNEIKEEYVLLFQYDSSVFEKMEAPFLERLKRELYVGAFWKHEIVYKNNRLRVGNGGTSFRNARVMEMICRQFVNKPVDAEDVFFAKRLRDLKYTECPREIAMRFSSELIYDEKCIYGHQIYRSISLPEVEKRMISLFDGFRYIKSIDYTI